MGGWAAVPCVGGGGRPQAWGRGAVVSARGAAPGSVQLATTDLCAPVGAVALLPTAAAATNSRCPHTACRLASLSCICGCSSAQCQQPQLLPTPAAPPAAPTCCPQAHFLKYQDARARKDSAKSHRERIKDLNDKLATLTGALPSSVSLSLLLYLFWGGGGVRVGLFWMEQSGMMWVAVVWFWVCVGWCVCVGGGGVGWGGGGGDTGWQCVWCFCSACAAAPAWSCGPQLHVLMMLLGLHAGVL